MEDSLDIQSDDVIRIAHALIDYVGFSKDVGIEALDLTLREVLQDFLGSLDRSPAERALNERLCGIGVTV